MRVVLLVTDHERGGTPMRLARLARLLRAVGVDVHAGCLAHAGPITTELAAAQVPTFTCDADDARDFLALKRLSQHLRRIRPQLIHATLMHANVAARIVGVIQRIPVIGSTATIEVERGWHRTAERATAGIDRFHIVNSVSVAEHVVRAFGIPRRRVRVVPPALARFPEPIERSAARAALGIAEHEFTVAWMGRFDPVKRLDLIVHVAEILTRVPSRFLLIGDGPQRPQIEQMLRLSSAGRTVQLLGWQSDITPILSAADVFLFPSRTEGMPNAVLEALAHGLPIIGSDIPALRELAGDGERMCLVTGDDPRDYAEALLAQRDNPQQRARLGEAGRAWARATLNPHVTVRRVQQVYRAAVHQPRTE